MYTHDAQFPSVQFALTESFGPFGSFAYITFITIICAFFLANFLVAMLTVKYRERTQILDLTFGLLVDTQEETEREVQAEAEKRGDVVGITISEGGPEEDVKEQVTFHLSRTFLM